MKYVNNELNERETSALVSTFLSILIDNYSYIVPAVINAVTYIYMY